VTGTVHPQTSVLGRKIARQSLQGAVADDVARTVVLLAAALVCAGGALALGRSWLRSERRRLH
jgi:hypothetical protein